MRFAPILAAALTLAAAPAAAQSWGGTWEHEQGRRGGWNSVPSTFDWRGQLDRPGDYRCDRFWDASRTDCDARWRDQRHRVSYQARRDYRALAGYDRDGYRGHYDRYGYGRAAYGYGYSPRRHGYGSGYGYGQGGAAYYAEYGRPDLVYPEGGGYGRGGYAGARDPHRIDWCRARYRSYDPSSGYYRAWSGRLIYCG